MSSGAIKQTGSGVLIKVYVAPRSSADRVVGEHNGAVKIALTAPPVEGAANKALVEFLAKKLAVPRSSVTLVSGETSRAKLLAVDGLREKEVSVRLGLSA